MASRRTHGGRRQCGQAMGDSSFLVHVSNSTVFVRKESPSRVPPSTLLCSAFVLGLSLNASACAGLAALRQERFHLRLLMHVALGCALDCACNVPASLLLMFAAPKTAFRAQVCVVSGVLGYLTPMLQSTLLAMLALERTLSLRRLVDYGHKIAPSSFKGCRKYWLLPLAAWLYAFLLAGPAVAMDLKYFGDRFACGLSNNDTILPTVHLVLGDFVPWLLIVICATTMVYQAITEHHRRRRAKLSVFVHRGPQQMQTHTWTSSDEPLLQDFEEQASVSYLSITILLALYTIFLVPHILSVHLTPFTVSVPRNTTSTMPVYTGSYDVIILWFRYIFVVLVPLVLFVTNKEVRKKCEHLFCFCCGRDNAVINIVEAQTVLRTMDRLQRSTSVTKRRLKFENHKDKYRTMTSFTTPVLFVTTQGLHLRLTEEDSEGGPPQFRFEFCDLAVANSGSLLRPAPRRRPPAPPLTIENSPIQRRKATSPHSKAVRFKQTVDEIPLQDSGAWSDQDQQQEQAFTASLNDTYTLHRTGDEESGFLMNSFRGLPTTRAFKRS